MDRLLMLRESVLKALEKAREEKRIGNSLEAEVRLRVPAGDQALVKKYKDELCPLFIVSSVIVAPEPGAELGVTVTRAPGQKCQRCWNYSPYVGQSRVYPQFCKRCEEVLHEQAR
jgi:isoleucyl-tRNA synthetase